MLSETACHQPYHTSENDRLFTSHSQIRSECQRIPYFEYACLKHGRPANCHMPRVSKSDRTDSAPDDGRTCRMYAGRKDARRTPHAPLVCPCPNSHTTGCQRYALESRRGMVSVEDAHAHAESCVFAGKSMCGCLSSTRKHVSYGAAEIRRVRCS